MENQWALQLQSSIIILPAACLGKYAYNKIVTMSQNEHQLSVKDFSHWHLGYYNRNGMRIHHNEPVDRLSWQKWK